MNIEIRKAQPRDDTTSRVWVVRKFWTAAKPYWRSEEKGSALTILGAILLLVLLKVYTVVTLNDAGGRFFNALQSHNSPAFMRTILFIGVFLAIQLVAIVLQDFLAHVLEVRWRRWLTHRFVSSWLADQAFYLMRFSRRTDNPDQRIAEDIRMMTSDTLTLGVGGLSTAFTVAAFAGVLWNLSGPLNISAGRISFHISGYMFWAALVYWFVGCLLGFAIGNPLIRLNNQQQRLEADFRFALVRIRESAEGIALYDGETQEASRTAELFFSVYRNSLRIVRMNAKLLAFQTFVGDGPSILPFLAAAPRFFAGALALGDLMKVGNGFGQISIALSWLVNSYPVYADWHATIDRLAEFEKDLAESRSRKNGIRAIDDESDDIIFDHVDVLTPDGETLFSNLSFALKRGESALFRGVSGMGKTTLFRVLSGMWPFARGRITLPKADCLFLPQESYLPIGALRAVLCFPHAVDAKRDEEMIEILSSVGLTSLIGRLSEENHWEQCLSPGERQRLAIAQAIYAKPDWLFLDEATSALDEDQEAQVYQALSRSLARATVISIGHRRTLDVYHDVVIDLSSLAAKKTIVSGNGGVWQRTSGGKSHGQTA